MLVLAQKTCTSIAAVLGLITIDYLIGKGLVEMGYIAFCKVNCFVKKTLREDVKKVNVHENSVNFSMLLVEICFLAITMGILNKYKQFRSRDRIDELLYESRDSLKQTNEFLEKWRLRRVPTEYSYLDDELQEIQPLRLEVPILHMAIVDTLGTTRSKLERGDAGDAINITDSTLLSSVSSLLESEFDLEMQQPSEERLSEGAQNVEFRSRYLWDLIEEDSNADISQ